VRTILFTAFLFLWLPATAQTNKEQCSSYHFVVAELKNGNSFEKTIGSGLVLKFKGAEDRGWEMTLEDRNGADRIYLANPPIRFNRLQLIHGSYGQTLRDQVSDRKLLFIWKTDEFSKLVNDALWPYNAADPEHAGEKYLNALAAVSLGEIKLHTRSYVTDRKGVLKSISWEVELDVPSEFKSELQKDKAADCPAFRY
jgi:hypothetical protein